MRHLLCAVTFLIVAATPLASAELVPVVAPTPSAEPFLNIYISAANAYHIPPLLLITMCEFESGHDPAAKGDGGKSIGQCQVQQDTAHWVGVYVSDSELARPRVNIPTAAAILAKCHENYPKAWTQVMACYGVGNGAVPRETVAHRYPKGGFVQARWYRWQDYERRAIVRAHKLRILAHR